MHFLHSGMQNNNAAEGRALLNDNFVAANKAKHFAGLFI